MSCSQWALRRGRTSARRLTLKWGAISPCRSCAAYLRACYCLCQAAAFALEPYARMIAWHWMQGMSRGQVHAQSIHVTWHCMASSMSRRDLRCSWALMTEVSSVRSSCCAPVILVEKDRHCASTITADDLRQHKHTDVISQQWRWPEAACVLTRQAAGRRQDILVGPTWAGCLSRQW